MNRPGARVGDRTIAEGVKLTDEEREAVTLARWYSADDHHRAVERIVAARLAQVTADRNRTYRISEETAQRELIQQMRAEGAESERDSLKAAVRALADEWEQAAVDGGPRNYAASLFATAARDLRAALPPEASS